MVSNDDGYDSPGIIELASQLNQIGDVLVVAPKEHHSGVARGIPFGEKARKSGIIEEHLMEISPDEKLLFFAVHGTPAQCVVHGVLELAPRKPDLCVTGINFGANIGRALNYSGTVGCAIEAADFSIPTIAVSQELDWDDIFGMKGERDVFKNGASIATELASNLLADPPQEKFYCLNVNFPHGVQIDTEKVLTKQSNVNRWTWRQPPKRDFSQHFAIEYGDADENWEPGSDAHAIMVEKKVSITPITWAIDARDGEYDIESLQSLSE